jgi:hypothetical protein
MPRSSRTLGPKAIDTLASTIESETGLLLIARPPL